ncbi:hypothetical protein F5Y19DRAFT_479766 [Xylariaceae sp. FL1651]|nr:hypothetical protein F5Y19DRAFT_479766 [Xylariaceae sp. FL1651]
MVLILAAVAVAIDGNVVQDQAQTATPAPAETSAANADNVKTESSPPISSPPAAPDHDPNGTGFGYDKTQQLILKIVQKSG